MALRERRFPDAAAAAQALSDAVAAELSAALRERPRASLVVSGGRSPIAFFESLREAPIDWPRVVVTLADERWVAAEHADSNARLLAEHLLKGRAAAARFVPLWNGAATPAAAIAERSAALASLPRPFDALVLGLGEDGHTASLFAAADGIAGALDPSGAALLAAIDPPAAAHQRLTLTLAALLDSRHIHLPVAGAAKLAVYRRALTDRDPGRLPVAAVLCQARVPLTVYLSP